MEDVKRLGRATQGVIVMRLRGDEQVSALAPVVEEDKDEEDDAEGAEAMPPEQPPVEWAFGRKAFPERLDPTMLFGRGPCSFKEKVIRWRQARR